MTDDLARARATLSRDVRTIRAPHLLAAALCSGLGTSVVLRVPPLVPGACAVALCLAGILAAGHRRALALALALAACGLAAGSARLEIIDRSALAAHVGDAGPMTAEVTGPARTGLYGHRVPVRVRAMWHEPFDEPALLRLPSERAPPPQGALLELIGLIREPRGAGPDGGFDERAYLRRQGVHVVATADDYRVVGARGGVAGVVDRARQGIARGLERGLAGERRALVAGVVLGADEGLTDELRTAFRRSGLYHLLAVSGQNVAYVGVGVVAIAWLVGLSRLAAEGAAIAAILAYVSAVGWQPSVVRAGIAGGLASLAWIAARPRDRWYFALVGAAVLLAWNPYSLLDPGFQLSFSAVAAIFLLAPRLDRLLEGFPVPGAVRTVLSISIACSIVTAPVLWLQFGSLSVLAVAANVLAAPVVAPILGLGLGAAALDPVLPWVATALGWLNGWLVAYLAWVARLVGNLPFAEVRSPGVILILTGTAGAVGALVLVPRRRLGPVAGTFALVAAAGVLWWGWLAPRPLAPPSGLRIAVLDVGQGDAILLQVPEGAILVDQGPPEARVAEQLEHLGVERLAALVLTHPQRDHIGGAADVLETYDVDRVIDSGQVTESPDARRALAVITREHVPVETVMRGRQFRLGGLTLTVLWPGGPPPSGDDPNLHAIVLLAAFGDVEALLTADAESEVTSRLALPPVEILKVAHHGSADPGLPALLERLTPRVAVISAGLGNDYGHPTPATLAALGAQPGLRLHRTDLEGTVLLETDGVEITVRAGA